MSRLTVGFIRHNFLPPSETFIYNSLRALPDGDVDVEVFALRRKSEQKFPADRITMPGWFDSTLYRVTRWSPQFFRWARGVQVLHAHFAWTAAYCMLAASRLELPLVTSFYGLDVTLLHSWERFDPGFWYYTLLRRRLFRKGDRFLALSNEMRRRLVAQGCPDDKIRIVRLGVDLARFAGERAPRTGPMTVLMVGREVEKKGFDDGLRACAAARDRGAELRVVLLGTGGPLLPALQKLAAELSLEVAWPDPSTRVVGAMAEADVLMVPSRVAADGDSEGTPTVICEGSAAGLPIVATRHAGIPEQVDDGKTGLLADERDVDGLAGHLVRLAADPALRAALGGAGRVKMAAEYSLAAHVRESIRRVSRAVMKGPA